MNIENGFQDGLEAVEGAGGGADEEELEAEELEAEELELGSTARLIDALRVFAAADAADADAAAELASDEELLEVNALDTIVTISCNSSLSVLVEAVNDLSIYAFIRFSCLPSTKSPIALLVLVLNLVLKIEGSLIAILNIDFSKVASLVSSPSIISFLSDPPENLS